MSICAFPGCSNSSYKLQRWAKTICAIHSVNHMHCDCPRTFKFFPFPNANTKPEERKIWTKAVNRLEGNTNWQPKSYSRICSCHFIDRKPTLLNPYPTKNIPKGCTTIPSRKLPANREPLPENSPAQKHTPYNPQTEHCYCINTNCSDCSKKITQLSKTVHDLVNKYEELCEKENAVFESVTEKSPSFANTFLETDQKVKQYTSVLNKQAFDDLLRFVDAKASAMRYWCGTKKSSSVPTKQYKNIPQKPGPTRKLSIKKELLLTLMKLRVATPNFMLADIFGVSLSVVSQIINTWVKFLAHELRLLVFWPSKDAINSHFPKSLPSKYRSLRCIIDCTEIFIEKPRNLELQALTWSDYKHHNTIKFLVGITPNGAISFISQAWGGRATDQYITRSSGFYDKLETGDLIMADRGFPIQEDLLLRHCTLRIPPPSSGLEQMSEADVLKTQDVANTRIHVERAIGQLKDFSILVHQMPISLIPLADDIIVVCAALHNLLPPLVK